MQIIYPHKHICRIYSWFPPEETKSEFVTACERLVAFWDGFGKMHHKEKQALLKISRSTYYRTRKFLEARELKSKGPSMSGKVSSLTRLEILFGSLERSIRLMEKPK